MTFLVDANVLSEAVRPAPQREVVAWLSVNEKDLVVDPIILGELRTGILTLPRGRKRSQLEAWFDTVVARIECIPWDSSVGLRWAQLVVELRSKGKAMPVLDAMIAATALAHDLTIASRNVRDFKKAGVRVFDPFG